MKAQETTSNKKNYNFTSIRVKDGTKEAVNKFLAKVNKTEDCGKVTSDLLINFFLEKVTKEDVDMLQKQALTWSHEERYLRKLWEKKRSRVSDDQWKKMLFLGELQDFISSHSRFRVTTNS